LISDGIRYGLIGKKKSSEIISMSSALMSSFMKKEDYDLDAIENEVLSQFMDIPSNDIASYLGNTKMMQRLLPMAIEFEGYAFSRDFINPMNTSSELQSILGLLCDFYSIDRKLILV